MTLGNTKDSTSNGSLITVPVAKKWVYWRSPSMLMALQRRLLALHSPMDCLNIDFIGPFPDKGYILVVVCTFTRWVELYATIDATSQSTTECLLQHFGRFGGPHQLRSDRGPCQCKISLPTQVYMFSIRRSRLYTSVCTIHVSMSCVAYRCTDPGP